ncbi:hypothetical protein VNO77_03661 [Canavalia gladiata]|uniref:Uncharacterized protein n=1 Tax=Canavalia gladiata TaxID=3824 RepID=A0AAN9MVX9_CANGL
MNILEGPSPRRIYLEREGTRFRDWLKAMQSHDLSYMAWLYWATTYDRVLVQERGMGGLDPGCRGSSDDSPTRASPHESCMSRQKVTPFYFQYIQDSNTTSNDAVRGHVRERFDLGIVHACCAGIVWEFLELVEGKMVISGMLIKWGIIPKIRHLGLEGRTTSLQTSALSTRPGAHYRALPQLLGSKFVLAHQPINKCLTWTSCWVHLDPVPDLPARLHEALEDYLMPRGHRCLAPNNLMIPSRSQILVYHHVTTSHSDRAEAGAMRLWTSFPCRCSSDELDSSSSESASPTSFLDPSVSSSWAKSSLLGFVLNFSDLPRFSENMELFSPSQETLFSAQNSPKKKKPTPAPSFSFYL